MLSIQKLIPAGKGLAAVLLKRAATIEVDWDVRQKSRFDATDSTGRHLGVFLPRGAVVRGGDVLVAEDGSMIVVKAAPQPVLEVRACAEHGSAFDLLRAAYHLGNRHVPLALQPDRLTLEPDHVLAEMLRRMHLIVNEVTAPFEPEAGAYAAGGQSQPHAHSHGQAHTQASPGHSRADSPEDASAHVHARETPQTEPAEAAVHVHGPQCSHGHDHGHDVVHLHPTRRTP